MRYPQPANEDDFEEFGLALLRRHWNCPKLERYGHRGENQDGVDIIDLGAGDPLRAAQCKHHAPDKTLPPSELRAEVEKARKFQPALDHYLVLTTAKKSSETQKELIVLNREQRERRSFSVELLTWEGIERLVDQYPEIQECLVPRTVTVVKEQYIAMGQQIAVDVAQTIRGLQGSANPDVHDAEIDEAKSHLERNEFQLARLLLNRLRQRHWDSLTSRQRYRVAANTAGAMIGEALFTEAGRLLVEAATYQPDDLEAQALGAVGHELLDEGTVAYAQAGEILARLPSSTKAASVRIRTAPSGVTLAQLRAEIQPSTIDAEVAVALAIRGVREKKFGHAKEFADLAIKESPDWPPAWLLLGQVHLAREIEKIQSSSPADRLFSRDTILEAERCLTVAIEKARASTPPHPILPDVLVARSQARELLTEGGGSEDVEEAYRLAPREPEVLLKYAVLLNARGKRDEAVRLAREAVTGGAIGARILLGIFLYQSADVALRAEAVRTFRDLALASEMPPQIDAAIYAVRAFCDRKTWSDAEEIARAMAARGEGVISKVFGSIIEQARGDLEASRRFALEAKEALSDVTPGGTVRAVADQLTSQGLHGEALPLWQRIYMPGYETPDARNLIACAERLERFDIVLDVCRSLREGGAVSRDIFEQEAALLERFDPRKAVILLQEFLAKNPEDRIARLRLSMVGIHTGRKDLIAAGDDDLPHVEDVEPDLLPYVVHVLRKAGRQVEALTYAYRGLRKHYGSHETHRAYLQLLAPGSGLGILPIRSEIAAPGTAVCFVEEGTDESVWVVIEDDIDCYPLLDERRIEDPLVRRLLGKRVDDAFDLVDSSVLRRSARVTQIVDKHIYRHRDVIHKWQLRFPDQPDVQMGRLGSPKPGADTQLELAPILSVVDAQASRASDVLSIYREKAIPVHVVANQLNRAVLAMSLALAEDAEQAIRVGSRDPAEIKDTLNSLRAGSVLVMDSSAIATMMLLDAEEVLSGIAPRVQLSFAVNDDCSRAAREIAKSPGTGRLFQVPGGHAFHVITAEESLASRRLEEQLVEFRRHIDLVGCPALAGLPPEQRKDLEHVFGLCGAEAIMCASVPGHVLWTDDYAQAAVARQSFGLASLPTDLVLRYLVGKGALETARYHLACAKLLAWNYVPTPVDSQILLQAAREAGWNPGRFPLSAAIGLMGENAFPSDGVGKIVCNVLPMLFDEIALPETRAALLTAILDQIARRQDWRPLIERIEPALVVTFGLNVIRCQEARSGIAAWLHHHELLR